MNINILKEFMLFFYKKLINIIYMIKYNIYQIFIKKLALLTYFIIFFLVFSRILVNFE